MNKVMMDICYQASLKACEWFHERTLVRRKLFSIDDLGDELINIVEMDEYESNNLLNIFDREIRGGRVYWVKYHHSIDLFPYIYEII